MDGTGIVETAIRLSDDPVMRDDFRKAVEQDVRFEIVGGVVQVHTPGSDKVWEVRRSKKDGTVYCNCPRWRFGGHSCKHLLAVIDSGIEVPEYIGKKR